MNRATAPKERKSMIEKWAMVNCTIYNKRIAILALQETYLDDQLLEQIRSCFGKNLDIINSPLPSNPCASAGVAFIINKALIHPKEYSVSELEPGRAIMIRLKWMDSCVTSIVNIYTPHTRNDQPSYWARVKTNRHTHCLPLPDFVLGDFNVTEDSIDRVPAHQDEDKAIEALRELCLNGTSRTPGDISTLLPDASHTMLTQMGPRSSPDLTEFTPYKKPPSSSSTGR